MWRCPTSSPSLVIPNGFFFVLPLLAQVGLELHDGRLVVASRLPQEDRAVIDAGFRSSFVRDALATLGKDPKVLVGDRPWGTWCRNHEKPAVREALRSSRAREPMVFLAQDLASLGVRLVPAKSLGYPVSWADVSKRYPEASALVGIGKPGYSRDHQTAVVVYAVTTASASASIILILENRGGSWVVTGSTTAECAVV